MRDGVHSLTPCPHLHLPRRDPVTFLQTLAAVSGVIVNICFLVHRVCPLFDESLIGDLLLHGFFRLLNLRSSNP